MRGRKSHIVIHHSATADGGHLDVQAIRKIHLMKGWRDIGYHLIFERIGSVYEAILGRPFHEDGAHCPGWNRRAVGVCFVGNWHVIAPPPELIGFGARHVAAVCYEMGIDPANIMPHKQVRQTKCPGDLFPVDTLKSYVRDMVEDLEEDSQ